MEQKKAYYIYGSSLMHSKKGEERPNHKYASREWKNGSWVYNYGNKGPVNQRNNNEKYAVNDKQKHDEEKADFNSKDWHTSAQYNFSKDNANDAKKQADEYTKLFWEEVALRDPAKLKEGWTDDEKERADYCRTHNVTGRMKMYSSIADAYNSIKDVGDIYVEKFVNPYKEAKAEMEKYAHSTNPNDRNKYYKAAKEYTKRYQDLKIAMDEYSNYIDKTLFDIKDIEELIKNGEDFHGNTSSYSTHDKIVPVNANIDDNLNILKNEFNKKYDTYI